MPDVPLAVDVSAMPRHELEDVVIKQSEQLRQLEFMLKNSDTRIKELEDITEGLGARLLSIRNLCL